MVHLVVVGAGAAGLMAARGLARAGNRVTVLEARDRCGGRIYPLPVEQFGYPAEGGPEFVHGGAPVLRALMREAGLSLIPRGGTRWRARSGTLRPDDRPVPYVDRFYRALSEVTADLPIGEFLATQFPGPQYAELRRAMTRTVEGYDAADPRRASTLALREEWMGRGLGQQGRITEGYGALIEHLAAQCRAQGVSVHLGAAVAAIDAESGGVAARCRGGASFAGDAAILTIPLPLWSEIALPPAVRKRAAAGLDIGYGNVVKILFRFARKWWAHQGGRDLSDLSFLISDATVPTWWTQHPAQTPVLTGWFAGPKADKVASLTESELVEMGLASLAQIFAVPRAVVEQKLVASRAINWGNDPYARGAYSYATPKTREAQSALASPDGSGVFFSGEALYAGRDMGTVEAALASGKETAETILVAMMR